MITPREEWHLETNRLGRRVFVFDRVESTNTLAEDYATDRRNDGLVLLAEEQTGGRGQHGRKWTALPRSSVLLSLVVFPPAELCRPAILTAWAAVAVCAVVGEVAGNKARIKWPNDVLIEGRKVCGILIEQSQRGPDRSAIVGIGLNVSQPAGWFAEVGLPVATSLAAVSGESLDTRVVARSLIGRLDAEYCRLCEGDWRSLETAWREHLGLVGREVCVECLGGVRRGQLLDVRLDGVTLGQEGGQATLLRPEEVLHIDEPLHLIASFHADGFKGKE